MIMNTLTFEANHTFFWCMHVIVKLLLTARRFLKHLVALLIQITLRGIFYPSDAAKIAVSRENFFCYIFSRSSFFSCLRDTSVIRKIFIKQPILFSIVNM